MLYMFEAVGYMLYLLISYLLLLRLPKYKKMCYIFVSVCEGELGGISYYITYTIKFNALHY